MQQVAQGGVHGGQGAQDQVQSCHSVREGKDDKVILLGVYLYLITRSHKSCVVLQVVALSLVLRNAMTMSRLWLLMCLVRSVTFSLRGSVSRPFAVTSLTSVFLFAL